MVAVSVIGCDRSSTLKIEEVTSLSGSAVFQPKDKMAPRTVLILTQYKNPISNLTEVSRCSGFALSKRIILTAAHCVKFDHFLSGEVQHSLFNVSTSFMSQNIRVHREYSGEVDRFEFENLRDIALIKLNADLPVQMEPFSFLGSDPGKQFVFRVLGYGQTQGSFLKKEPKSSTLRQASLSETDFDFKKAYFEINQPKGGICFGDSGGPAFVGVDGSEFLFAIAVKVLFDPSKVFVPSYDGCKEKGVFLNLFFFKDWLQSTYSELLHSNQ